MSTKSETPDCRHDAHPTRDAFTVPPDTVVENAAAMLRAAGDTGRLRLLMRLADGERCVTELAEAEGEKIATVSARLKQLHDRQLVTRRREAKHVHYALTDEHVARLLRDVLDHAAESVSSA